MKHNLIYRGPEASHATRPIARRSKGSLRGLMLVFPPGFPRPRIIQFESALEYAFLCLMLVRGDVHHIQEQPPAVAFTGADGRPAHHTFDFLITLTSGERIAVAIKPMSRVDAGAEALVIPSAASIRRRLNMADPFYVYAKRYSAAAAASRFTLFGSGPDVQYPLERVEMDENRLDVISLLTLSGIWDHLPRERQERFESGRRWLYIAIDCATKCVVSMRLAETPNSDDAIRDLRDIFEDKTPIAKAAGCESTWHHHGGIGTLVTDMGSAFVSDNFQGTMASLGVTAHLPPAGLPWLRGHIESFFRTLGHQLMPLLAGRTFFDTVQRGDYPSEQLACLCDDDLVTILLTYIVDIYHNQPHGSLKGETPNAAWTRLVAEHGAAPVPDGLTLRKAFGRPMSRKLRGDGVMFCGLTYSCDALREAFLHSPTRTVETCDGADGHQSA